MMNGFGAMVAIPLETFERLVRESEQIAIIKKMAKNDTCIFSKDLDAVLNNVEGSEE